MRYYQLNQSIKRKFQPLTPSLRKLQGLPSTKKLFSRLWAMIKRVRPQQVHYLIVYRLWSMSEERTQVRARCKSQVHLWCYYYSVKAQLCSWNCLPPCMKHARASAYISVMEVTICPTLAATSVCPLKKRIQICLIKRGCYDQTGQFG